MRDRDVSFPDMAAFTNTYFANSVCWFGPLTKKAQEVRFCAQFLVLARKLEVSNGDLAEIVETSDEWISQRTGIRSNCTEVFVHVT